MLLSDRDLRAEIESGRVGVDPYDPAMIQPSSVDLRLDRYFRVFQNHRYGFTAGFIDPGFTGHVTLRLSNMVTLGATGGRFLSSVTVTGVSTAPVRWTMPFTRWP